MKPLKFSPRADADLDQIFDYFRRVAPETVPRIAADIDDSLGLIAEHPEMYAKVPGKSYRRYVTHRYHFKIAYRITQDSVVIIGIYRFQNRTA